ncbi:MAG: hypothetical protein WCD13_12915, partial [Pseudolabrys sp.]
RLFSNRFYRKLKPRTIMPSGSTIVELHQTGSLPGRNGITGGPLNFWLRMRDVRYWYKADIQN